MHGSTLALYRVILCATDITKGNDEYATSCWTRVAPLRCACRDVNRGGRLRPRSPAAADPDRRGAAFSFPQTLTLSFSEGIEPAFSGVTVTGPQQHAVATGKLTRSADNPAEVTLPLAEALPPGEYTVAWHVVSVDGHKTKGQYTFSVK